MDFSPSLRQIPSLDDFHAQLIVKLVMLLKQGNQMLLNGINCTIIGVISYPFEFDVEGVFTEHSNQNQVLQIIRNAPLLSAIKYHFDALVAYDETRIKLKHLTALRYYNFATI